jgi:hypothetical protein
MPVKRIFGHIVLGLLCLTIAIGCGGSPSAVSSGGGEEQTQQAKSPVKPASEEHGHKPGSHGGTIIPIGRDNYHAEAVVEKGGVFRLYTLGKDESRVLDIEEQTLTAHVKAEDGLQTVAVALKPAPQAGDAAGKTSQFVGSLPKELWGKNIVITINNLRIQGDRFRIGFNYAATPHDEAMPDSLAGSEEEKKLFLTPGGRYTAADIQANGSVTASERYRDFRPAHDLKPRPGDKICPITLTKASAKCTWTVGGQSYEFCCPPCIEEFVKLAKDQPEEIQAPETYRKK